MLDVRTLPPEERLDMLYTFLINKDPRALELFKAFSSDNQFLTFLQTAPFNSLNKIARIGEYIVIRTIFYGTPTFIIGLDENYNFFCHRLPDNLAIDVENLTDMEVRDLMGFDYHAWEAKPSKYYNGVRIRIQGDVVLTIIDMFSGEQELFLYILLNLVLRKCYTGSFNIYRAARKGAKLILRRGYLDRDSILKIIDYICEKCGLSWSARVFEEYALGVMDTLASRERFLRVLIGEHRIRFLGVPLWRLPHNILASLGFDWGIIRTWGFRANRDGLLFMILRPHIVSAYHDEHGVSSIMCPMSIIRIGTLASSPHRIGRENLDAFRSVDRATSYDIFRVDDLFLD